MKQKPKAERLMTQSEYAKHRGKSRQYIGKLVKSGVLIMRGEKIAVEMSDSVLDNRALVAPVQPNGVGGSPGTGEAPSYAQARLDREIYTGRLRRLEFESKSGELIPAGVVAEKWTAIAQTVRMKLQALPSRLAPNVAALSDVRQVRDLLSKEVALILREVSTEIRFRFGAVDGQA